jgi:hypothetical protein
MMKKRSQNKRARDTRKTEKITIKVSKKTMRKPMIHL